MPYSVLTTIAMSTSYLLLIDDAVFDDWISAYVFISEGEVPPPLQCMRSPQCSGQCTGLCSGRAREGRPRRSLTRPIISAEWAYHDG